MRSWMHRQPLRNTLNLLTRTPRRQFRRLMKCFSLREMVPRRMWNKFTAIRSLRTFPPSMNSPYRHSYVPMPSVLTTNQHCEYCTHGRGRECGIRDQWKEITLVVGGGKSVHHAHGHEMLQQCLGGYGKAGNDAGLIAAVEIFDSMPDPSLTNLLLGKLVKNLVIFNMMINAFANAG